MWTLWFGSSSRIFGVDRDLGRAGDHHPMLGAVLVALQAEAAAGGHDDLLDLEGGALVQDLEAAPGALLLGVGVALGAARGPQHGDQVADRIAPAAIGDQDCVVGLDHRQIADSGAGDQPPLGVDQAVLGVIEQNVALDRIARLVLGQLLPKRLPGAEVGPDRVAGHDRDPVALLHDRLVDRLGRHGLIQIERDLEGAARDFPEAFEGALHRSQDRRGMAAELGQDPIGPEQEHAAVPEMAARGQHRLGDRLLGLLDEAADPERARRVWDRLAGLDVAVAGLGPGGCDAEGHQLARRGQRQGSLERLIEGVRGLHQMVRGADPEQRVGAEPLLDIEGGERDRGRGVAPDRLEQPVVGERRIDLLELASDQEVLGLGADHDHVLGQRPGEQAARGLLEQRRFGGQLGQLLGQGVAADRPEAGAGAAGENHGHECGHGGSCPPWAHEQQSFEASPARRPGPASSAHPDRCRPDRQEIARRGCQMVTGPIGRRGDLVRGGRIAYIVL